MIGCEGAEALSEALKVNTSLRELNLAGEGEKMMKRFDEEN